MWLAYIDSSLIPGTFSPPLFAKIYDNRIVTIMFTLDAQVTQFACQPFVNLSGVTHHNTNLHAHSVRA